MTLADALSRHPFTWFGGHDARDTGLILRVSTEQAMPVITGSSSSNVYTGVTPLGGDRHAVMFDNAKANIHSLTFFAWAFVVLAAIAVGLSAWNFGAFFTVAHLWFLGSAVNLAATGLFGLRRVKTLRRARVNTRIMVGGLALGLTAFTVACGLLAEPVIVSLLF